MANRFTKGINVAKYTPRTLEELSIIPMAYTQQGNQMLSIAASQNELGLQTSQMDLEGNQYAKKLQDNWGNRVKGFTDDFMSTGFTNQNVRSNLMSLTEDYKNLVNGEVKALNNRTAQMQNQISQFEEVRNKLIEKGEDASKGVWFYDAQKNHYLEKAMATPLKDKYGNIASIGGANITNYVDVAERAYKHGHRVETVDILDPLYAGQVYPSLTDKIDYSVITQRDPDALRYAIESIKFDPDVIAFYQKLNEMGNTNTGFTFNADGSIKEVNDFVLKKGEIHPTFSDTHIGQAMATAYFSNLGLKVDPKSIASSTSSSRSSKSSGISKAVEQGNFPVINEGGQINVSSNGKSPNMVLEENLEKTNEQITILTSDIEKDKEAFKSVTKKSQEETDTIVLEFANFYNNIQELNEEAVQNGQGGINNKSKEAAFNNLVDKLKNVATREQVVAMYSNESLYPGVIKLEKNKLLLRNYENNKKALEKNKEDFNKRLIDINEEGFVEKENSFKNTIKVNIAYLRNSWGDRYINVDPKTNKKYTDEQVDAAFLKYEEELKKLPYTINLEKSNGLFDGGYNTNIITNKLNEINKKIPELDLNTSSTMISSVLGDVTEKLAVGVDLFTNNDIGLGPAQITKSSTVITPIKQTIEDYVQGIVDNPKLSELLAVSSTKLTHTFSIDDTSSPVIKMLSPELYEVMENTKTLFELSPDAIETNGMSLREHFGINANSSISFNNLKVHPAVASDAGEVSGKMIVTGQIVTDVNEDDSKTYELNGLDISLNSGNLPEVEDGILLGLWKLTNYRINNLPEDQITASNIQISQQVNQLFGKNILQDAFVNTDDMFTENAKTNLENKTLYIKDASGEVLDLTFIPKVEGGKLLYEPQTKAGTLTRIDSQATLEEYIGRLTYETF